MRTETLRFARVRSKRTADMVLIEIDLEPSVWGLAGTKPVRIFKLKAVKQSLRVALKHAARTADREFGAGLVLGVRVHSLRTFLAKAEENREARAAILAGE